MMSVGDTAVERNASSTAQHSVGSARYTDAVIEQMQDAEFGVRGCGTSREPEVQSARTTDATRRGLIRCIPLLSSAMPTPRSLSVGVAQIKLRSIVGIESGAGEFSLHSTPNSDAALGCQQPARLLALRRRAR